MKKPNSRTTGPRGYGLATSLRILCLSVAVGLMVIVAIPGSSWRAQAATNRFVATTGSDTSNDCSNSGSPCATIQHAVDQAASGDTINVAAGTYFEHVTISKSVTIQGSLTGSTTVNGSNNGAVFSISSGTIALNYLTITNGLGGPGGGGGILNRGTVNVTNSTISGNSAQSAANNGGGILNNGGTLTVINSTISGNTASGSGEFGGGIFNNSLGTVTVINSTIANNSAAASAGGGIRNAGTVNIKNSIVANNTVGDCQNFGAFNTSGVNFSTDASCPGFTHVTSAQLNLGPLANNGGPTKTHALLAPSVAIDAVTDCTDLSTPTPMPVTIDQRGVVRPLDGDGNGTALCDAGAYELQPCTLTCPANQTVQAGANCQATVNPGTATATGDCPGVMVSGTRSDGQPLNAPYPLGVTTITWTVTDAAGNMAVCTQTITVLFGASCADVCLQDDSNPSRVLLWNSFTGDYLFCCGGMVFTGRGTAVRKGNIFTLTHYAGDRRVYASTDLSQKKGIASLQTPPGVLKCSIIDRDTSNNSCQCAVTAPPVITSWANVLRLRVNLVELVGVQTTRWLGNRKIFVPRMTECKIITLILYSNLL